MEERFRYTKAEIQYILLAATEGMTPHKLGYLMDLYITPEKVWENISPANPEVAFLGQKLINRLLKIKNNQFAQEYFQTLREKRVVALCPLSPYYPKRLLTIPDAPTVLFVKGSLEVFTKPAVAIVGSRKCTLKGRETAREFAKELARHGVAVISGLAKGIDSEAHQGALEAAGETVAVLGCGADICYPAENQKLFEEIPHNGALVTEYAVGAKPYPGNFPRRNRIISGLCDILLVVEAGQKSGALITVETAVNQGREVRCIPGDIHSPNSLGVNNLIRDGAKVVLSAADILEELGIPYIQAAQRTAEPTLTGAEKQIYDLLFEGEKTVEELCQLLGMPAAEINSVLTMMELRDIVKQSPGRIFNLNR